MEELIRGNTDKERLESAKALLLSQKRKMPLEKIRVQLPTLPISICPDSVVAGQVLCRFLFPQEGSIVRVVSNVAGCRTATIEATLTGEDSVKGKKVTVGDGTRKADIDLQVACGDLLEVTFIEADLGNRAEGERVSISLAFLFQPKVDPKACVRLA